MAKMEQMELDTQRAQLNADVNKMVEKYRSIFEWNVPDLHRQRREAMPLADGVLRLFPAVQQLRDGGTAE